MDEYRCIYLEANLSHSRTPTQGSDLKNAIPDIIVLLNCTTGSVETDTMPPSDGFREYSSGSGYTQLSGKAYVSEHVHVVTSSVSKPANGSFLASSQTAPKFQIHVA
jgi:hypothetical protein